MKNEQQNNSLLLPSNNNKNSKGIQKNADLVKAPL